MNGFNSASEAKYSTCLPPEAYLRIIRSCATDIEPRFMSTVYPIKKVPEAKKAPEAKKQGRIDK
jgi:hypothetical protein